MVTELHEHQALELWDLIRRRTVSSREVVAHYLDRIERLDAPGAPGAFVTVDAERALAAAAAIDARDDRTGIIFGLPFADKDLTQRAGQRTTFGSRIRAGFVPTYSDRIATVLDAAGGVSLGTTASPEFGLSGYTASALHGETTIPGFSGYNAGGSSGGAAAAVAAGLLPFAPGSDGGGSVRIPAANCGLVGLRPSRGRLPASSGQESPGGLVVAGGIGRTVADVALLTEAMLERRRGAVVHDRTLRSPAVDDGSLLAPAIRGEAPGDAARQLRIAVLDGTPWDDAADIVIDEDARLAVGKAVDVFAAAGHELVELGMPALPGYAEAFTTLWRANAASIPFADGELAQLEPLTRWLVDAGRALSAADLVTALRTLAEFERTVVQAFAPFDAVLTPATAIAPRPVGWFAVDPAEDFRRQVLHTPHTSFVNVVGLPAITLPVHRTAEHLGPDGAPVAAGLPMGVQLIGRPGSEGTLLALGRQLERRIPWHERVLARMQA